MTEERLELIEKIYSDPRTSYDIESDTLDIIHELLKALRGARIRKFG